MHSCLEDKWSLDLCPPLSPLQKSQSCHLFLSLVLSTTLNNHSSLYLDLPSSNQQIFQCLFSPVSNHLAVPSPPNFPFFSLVQSSSSHSANPNFPSHVSPLPFILVLPSGTRRNHFYFLFSFIYFRNSSPSSKMFNFTLVLVILSYFSIYKSRNCSIYYSLYYSKQILCMYCTMIDIKQFLYG